MPPETQRELVLAMLIGAAERGTHVTSGEFLAEHLPRFGARIYELREQGWVVRMWRLGEGSYAYRLTAGPSGQPYQPPGSTVPPVPRAERVRPNAPDGPLSRPPGPCTRCGGDGVDPDTLVDGGCKRCGGGGADPGDDVTPLFDTDEGRPTPGMFDPDSKDAA